MMRLATLAGTTCIASDMESSLISMTVQEVPTTLDMAFTLGIAAEGLVIIQAIATAWEKERGKRCQSM
jgi:hypothetical protein